MVHIYIDPNKTQQIEVVEDSIRKVYHFNEHQLWNILRDYKRYMQIPFRNFMKVYINKRFYSKKKYGYILGILFCYGVGAKNINKRQWNKIINTIVIKDKDLIKGSLYVR